METQLTQADAAVLQLIILIIHRWRCDPLVEMQLTQAYAAVLQLIILIIHRGRCDLPCRNAACAG
jgi:hypothetical protein